MLKFTNRLLFMSFLLVLVVIPGGYAQNAQITNVAYFQGSMPDMVYPL